MSHIILLDLNYTLAAKTGMNPGNFTYDVSKDIYRKDLVDALKNKRIFLITARTSNYELETIKKIQQDTGLEIERYYFKPESDKYIKAEDFKKAVVLKLFEEGFQAKDFYGIESNIKTRKAYKSIGIESCRYEQYMKQLTQ